MSHALELFRRHADPAKGSASFTERRLTEAGFARIWAELTGEEEEELPPKVLAEAFRHATQARELYFSQFAVWFSSRCFSEDVSLDKESKHLRSIARKHSMHHTQVEHYKQIFQRFDKDGDGTIDSNEFEELLCTCIKAPSSIGLPAARVKHLWQVADEDANNEIDFEEFLEFYAKYLGVDSHGFEDFYRFGNLPGLTT